jgi:hypothetical protein
MRVVSLYMIYNKIKSMRIIFFSIVALFFSENIYGQGCCSGGSGSPIAGGASQGVLLDRQMEISSNFQYISSDQFKAKNKDTAKLFDNYNSKYIYTKIAYGVTKDLTVSIESGYFVNKTQIGFNKIDTLHSSGVGDLIIFPRYDILNRTTESKRVEITLGLGYKIPIGKYNDSTLVYSNPITGQKTFTTLPPLVQPTNGSQDIIFYAFFFRGFPKNNFRIFANTLYIKKGWNSLGEKFGDYASIGVFAGKTFFKKLGVTFQIKGETVGRMQFDKNIDMLALYNVDVKSTGNKKISFVPQVSYSYKSFTVFALGEFPLYEYVYGVQVSAQHQFTAGVSYRFFTYKSLIPANGEAVYVCPMNCEGSQSSTPDKCKICGMELVKKKN